MFCVKFANDRVRKQFDILPDEVYARVDEAVLALSADPYPRGVKKLSR
jgi:hypothetical protein